jgi:hypothetical protein
LAAAGPPRRDPFFFSWYFCSWERGQNGGGGKRGVRGEERRGERGVDDRGVERIDERRGERGVEERGERRKERGEVRREAWGERRERSGGERPLWEVRRGGATYCYEALRHTPYVYMKVRRVP